MRSKCWSSLARRDLSSLGLPIMKLPVGILMSVIPMELRVVGRLATNERCSPEDRAEKFTAMIAQMRRHAAIP